MGRSNEGGIEVNQCRKRIWSGVLAICLLLSLLPDLAAAAGGEAPTTIAAVTADAAAESGAAGDITVRTANVFSFGADDTYLSIPLEVEGLPAGSWSAKVRLDSGTERSCSLTKKPSGISTGSYSADAHVLTEGTHQFSVTVSSNDAGVTFGTVILPVYLVPDADLPISADELNRENAVSVYESSPSLNFYVPRGTLNEGQKYTLRLLQNDTEVGGTLPDRGATVWDTTMIDPRYGDVFREKYQVRYDAQRISGTVYLQSPLTVEGGTCDLEISLEGQTVYTLPNAAVPSELPVVDSMDIPYADNVPGQESLWCVLNITGGHPDQFQVKVYQGTEQLGVSQGYRVTYVNYSEIRTEYEIRLEEPLQGGTRYTAVVERKDGGSFVGERQKETYISGSVWIMDGIFPSHYYANVILDTFGTDPAETYKLTLNGTNQQELAWATASPDANGRFEAEFLDEDGMPVRLAPNAQYQLRIYRKSQAGGQWEQAANQWIYNSGIMESALQPQSADTPLVLDLTSGSVIDSDDGVIQVNLSVKTGSALPDNLNLFQLRLNGVVGNTMTLDPTECDRQDYANSIYLKLYYDAPAGASWYWPELLYDGGGVINSNTGENALNRTYPLRSDEMVRAYGSSSQTDSGLYFMATVMGRNLDGQDVELHLYQYGNRSLTPDAVLTLTEAEEYKITETHMEKLDPNARYVGEFWVDGVPVGAESNYSYFNVQADVLNWNKVSYTATAEAAANGTLELLTVPKNEDGSIPALNEIYVRAVADSGYRLKAGSIKVNGQPILGRSFLLTENSTVTAEFEPIPAVTYPVEVAGNLTHGTLEPNVTRAAQGQTVAVTVVPERGWEAYSVVYYLGGIYQGEPISLTQTGTNTYTFVMPGEPVYLSATFTPAQSYSIQTSSLVTGGSFTHPASAYAGDRVEFTAAAEQGYRLEPSSLRVRYPNAVGTDTDVPVTAVEGKTNTYTFTMPAYIVEIYGVFVTSDLPAYKVQTFSAQGGTVYPVGGESYYPGDPVTIEVRAQAGYELEPGSLNASYVQDGTAESLALAPLGDNQWQFTMPEGEVSLAARFELSGNIPQQPDLLLNDTVARSAGDWYLPLQIPEELRDQLYGLYYDSLYLQAQIIDQEGRLISRQECRQSYDRIYLTNCGLAAGDYTLNVIAGDADNLVILGGDTLHVVDGVAYSGSSSRNILTNATKVLDAEFNLSCAITDLKGTYTATLRDEAGTVYASSSDYQILYYGGSGKNTADDDGSTVEAYTNIRFQMPITGTLSSGRTYHLELSSGGMTLVAQNQPFTLQVTDGVVVLEGVYDKVTRLWTAPTENLAPGAYSAVYYQYNGYETVAITYPAVVDADGVLTVTDPLDGLDNSSRSFALKNSSGDELAYFSVSSYSGGDTVWYEVTLAGASHALYSPYISNFGLVYPMSASRTIQAELEGAAGAGGWRLYLGTGTNDQPVASGPVSDLSTFSFTVPEGTDPYEQHYTLSVLDGEGNQIGQCFFAFTVFELLTTEENYWGDVGAGTEYLTVYPMNPEPGDTLSVFVGYRDSMGIHALPTTENGDGSWTVDLSQVPYGSYKPALGLYGTADDSLNVNWTFRRASAVKEQLPKVTVAWPVLSSDASGNTLASVTYEGGAPSSDVTMHIYTLEDDTASFLRSVSIGRETYTVNSGALGLYGSYLFCFTLADGTSIGQWSAHMGTLSVVFLDWDGSVLKAQQVSYGQSAVPPQAPQRDSYVFTGWSGTYTNVTENRQIVAQYAPQVLKVQFFLTGGTNGPKAQQVPYGQAAEKPAKTPTRAGYTFTGWYAEPGGTQPFDFGTKLQADTVLYAGWKEVEYTITLRAGTEVDRLLVNGQPASGTWSARSGDLVEVRFASAPRPLSLSYEGASLTPYFDGTYWTAVFTMPGRDITLAAQYEATGTLEIQADGLQVSEYLLTSDSGMYLGTGNKSEAPVGTYTLEVWLNDGQHFQRENVVLSQGQTTTVTFQPGSKYHVTFVVTGFPNENLPSGLTLSVYGMGTDGSRMYYVDTVPVGTGTVGIDLPDGRYFLAAGAGTVTKQTDTFTVSGQALSHSVALQLGLDIPVELSCTGTAEVPGTAYVTVESKLGNGEWGAVYTASVGSSGSFLLENVILETGGEYRLRLTDFYDRQGIQRQFASEPVGFTHEGMEKVCLTYQLQENDIPNFSGGGNGVLLSRSTAYPGDTVELIVRYNGTAAPTEFTVRLPEGLASLEGGNTLTLIPDGGTQGTVRAMVKVAGTAQRGTCSIPVEVTAGGESYAFSAAVLTVGQPTLNGPAMAKAGEPFHVYGEAPEGSKITIRGASGQVYAVTVAEGRFYNTSVTLSEGDTLTGEVAVEGNAVQTNELEVMVTEDQPLALTGVTYDGTTAAVWNSKLDSYLFNQYVDMELKGYDLRFSASFNRADVYSVLYHFCGREYPASGNGSGTWTAAFDRGTWGGAGLKDITATVVLYDGYTYTSVNVPVAIVNLLVDPSGVITDENGQPLAGVTVRCQVWDETTNAWKDLDAAAIGQTNPQVTDSEGRYGWYVPEGKYRVLAFKEGYLDYDSSLHAGDFEPDWDGTIPPARTDINFSMTPVRSTYTVYPTAVTGGTVEAADSAQAGQPVTLTVTPEEGLQVSSVTVLTLSGTSVSVDKGQAENTYTFTMPYADVTYRVAFSGTRQTTLAIASAGSDGKVEVTIRSLLENAMLTAAYYDEDGRLLGAKTQAVVAGIETARLTVPYSGTAAMVRVFLLDQEQKPLAPSADYPLK